MKLSDLQTGMVVQVRNLQKFFVLGDYFLNNCIGEGFHRSDFNEDMFDCLCKYTDDWDIIRVYEPSQEAQCLEEMVDKHGKCIFERLEQSARHKIREISMKLSKDSVVKYFENKFHVCKTDEENSEIVHLYINGASSKTTNITFTANIIDCTFIE